MSETSSSRRVAVLVLGTHRSGTSSLSGTLARLGCAAPATLMGANEFNERGYYESERIVAFDDAILASAGSAWDDWRAFNPSWRDSPVAPGFLDKGRALLAEEYGDGDFIALKDPRMCRFADLWLEILNTADYRVVTLIPFRHPFEVAASLDRRDRFGIEHGLLLWLRNTLDAEFATRTMPRFVFPWESLLADWRSVLAGAARALDVVWPRWSDVASAEVDTFLSDDLRHNRRIGALDAPPGTIRAWALEAWAALRVLAESPDSTEARAELDRLRAVLDQGSLPFGAAFVALEARHKTIVKDMADLRMHVDFVERRTAEAVASASAEVASAHARVENAMARAAILESERDGARLDLVELTERNAARCGDLEAANTQAEARIAALEAEVAESRRLLAAALESIEDLDRTLAAERADRDAHRTRLAGRIGRGLATRIVGPAAPTPEKDPAP